MAFDIQSMLGYHGNEVRYYDELLGGKGQWRFAGSPNLLDLLSVRYLLMPQAQAVPGYHQVVGPVTTAPGGPAVLLERDTVPKYVRVVPGAAKLPEDQVVPTVVDPRFPLDAVVLYTDTASVSPEPVKSGTPETAPTVQARLSEWAPGHMRIALEGSAPKATYLLVAETWYPDWHAAIDGRPVTVLRADHALLSVVLPSGAREVTLRFDSAAYARGKIMTLVALVAALGLLAAPLWSRRRTVHA
jgi:hypothetical protein